MAAKQVLLTDEGLHNLEQELEFLKTERRKEIAEKIKVASFLWRPFGKQRVR